MKHYMKKVVSILLAVSLTASLTACSNSKASNEGAASESGSSSQNQIVTTMNTESGTMDSAGEISYWWWSYDAYCCAPLVELAEDGSYDYILAESCDINDSMTEFTFHIRTDAKWNNGDDVTSEDFYNTITRALDPACGNGYSSMLFCISGAQDIYENGADMSTLGVECVDDKTLKFTLADATAYFLDLFSLPVFMPTHRELQTETNGAWSKGEDMDKLVSCGPFYLAEYVPNQYCIYKRNETYVQADRISLDSIKALVMDDSQAIINAYRTGELNYATADYTVLEEYADSDELVVNPSITSYYELFNVNKAPFDDVRVREAFSISIDREQVATACGTSYEASTFFVAKHLVSKSSGQDWADEAGGDLLTYDVERAKELLAEAGYPDGEGFPTVTYKYPSTQVESDIAQALQAQWKENLGITVELEAQEQQVNISDRRAGDFDICRMRWTADFADPFTYLAMYMSTDGYNDNGCACEEYDELMKATMTEQDVATRYELMHEAEKVLVAEYFWAIPVLNAESIYLINTEFTNFVIDPSRNSIRTKYIQVK